MKKFAIGCFAVLLVLGVVAGGLAWFKIITPGMQMAGNLVELGQEFQRLNERVENQAAFQPPVDGQLDAGTLQRFLAAQREIRAALQGRLDELRQKYELVEKRVNEQGGRAGVGDLFGAYADIGALLIDGKRAQVEALNSQRFSLAEYAWARNRIYRALGKQVAVAIPDEFGPQGLSDSREVAPETAAMIEPHRQELLESLVIAWWGF